MNWKILNQPLGMPCSDNYTTNKEVAWLPIALGAASLASSLWGAKKSADAADEAREQQEAERARIEAERRRKQNQSWTDTASGQNTIRVLQESARKFVKRAQGAQAVGGGTDAAVAIEKEQQNQKQADVIAQANAAYEDRKENIDASYRADLARVNHNIQQAQMAKADATAQAASAASSALMQGALMTAEPAMKQAAPVATTETPTTEPAGVSPGAAGGEVKPVEITPKSVFEHQKPKVEAPKETVEQPKVEPAKEAPKAEPAKTTEEKQPKSTMADAKRLAGFSRNYNTLIGLNLVGKKKDIKTW